MGSFSLTDLCGCPDPCPECCAGCCPNIGTSTLYLTFTGFDTTPSGSYALAWDSGNQWWGKTNVVFDATYSVDFWIVCTGTQDACTQFELRYTVYESGVELCDYAEVGNALNPWRPDVSPACDCDPFSLNFTMDASGDCLGGNVGEGEVAVTT